MTYTVRSNDAGADRPSGESRRARVRARRARVRLELLARRRHRGAAGHHLFAAPVPRRPERGVLGHLRRGRLRAVDRAAADRGGVPPRARPRHDRSPEGDALPRRRHLPARPRLARRHRHPEQGPDPRARVERRRVVPPHARHRATHGRRARRGRAPLHHRGRTLALRLAGPPHLRRRSLDRRDRAPRVRPEHAPIEPDDHLVPRPGRSRGRLACAGRRWARSRVGDRRRPAPGDRERGDLRPEDRGAERRRGFRAAPDRSLGAAHPARRRRPGDGRDAAGRRPRTGGAAPHHGDRGSGDAPRAQRRRRAPPGRAREPRSSASPAARSSSPAGSTRASARSRRSSGSPPTRAARPSAPSISSPVRSARSSRSRRAARSRSFALRATSPTSRRSG